MAAQRRTADDDRFSQRVLDETNARRNQLTEEEVLRVRELLKQDDRVIWLWSTAKTWAVWITAVVLGVTVGFDGLVKIIKALGGR